MMPFKTSFYFYVFIGTNDDIQAAQEFIKKKYLSLVPVTDHYTEKNIYPHFTCSVGEYGFSLYFFFIPIHR